MSSLMTNAAAMTALQTLRNVNGNLATTQNRISTGYRVATASDNSAYWSIATTMRSDNAALSAVSDALGLGAATVDTMYTALETVVGDEKRGLTALQAKLTAARQPGMDRNKVQAEITAILDDLKNTSDLAVFNGENWLSVDSQATGYNADKAVVSSFSRAGGVVTINTINIDVDSIKLYDETTVTGSVTTGVSSSFTGSAGTIAVSIGSISTVITVTTSTTMGEIVDQLRALNIEGVSFGTDNAGKLYVANRSDTLVTLTGDANTGGTVTAAAITTGFSERGILNDEYDVFDGAAWQKKGVADIDIADLTDSAEDLELLEQYISVVDSALAKVTQASADLGAVKIRIDSNSDFVKSLMDAIDRGIGQLVDADMNAESTRLQALQVQQQLGIQALSIANSNSQSILSLFRG